MASNKRTIYIGMDYSDFSGGVTEINRKMGLLDAEFKFAQEQIKNYGTEADAAGTKTEYLAQKIALQEQKVQKAKEAYDAAMSSQTASAATIDNLDKKLLQERTSLEKLKGQLKKADEEQKKLDKDTKSFGDAIRGLASDLGVSISPAIEKLASKFDGVDASIGNAVLGIGAITAGFISCAKAAAKNADDLLTLASTSSMTTTELQRLQYASNFVDVSVDTMSGSIKKLTSNMKSASEGNKGLQDAFKKLGVRVTDSRGHLRDANEVFYEAIDRLKDVKRETDRNAIAMELFGKSATELNPLISAGSKALKEYGDEAEKLGRVMSEEELAKAGKFADALDRFEAQSESLKNSLGMVLLPMLTNLFDIISKIPTPVLKTITVLATTIATIVMVVKAIKSVTDTTSTVKGFFKMAGDGASKTTLIILGIVAALIALATVIAVIIGKSDDLQRSMASVGQSVSQVQQDVSQAQRPINKRNYASGGVVGGGEVWVGEAGPERVALPEGSRVYSAEESQQRAGDVFNVNLTVSAANIKEFNDVVNIVKGQRVAAIRGASLV